MNIAQMALIAVTVGQALKEFLRRWVKLEGKLSVIFMILVSAGVVGYKFVTENMAFDLATFLILVAEVSTAAIGGKLTAASIAKKVSTGEGISKDQEAGGKTAESLRGC